MSTPQTSLQSETVQYIEKEVTSAIKTWNPFWIPARVKLYFQWRTQEVIDGAIEKKIQRIENLISHVGEENLQILLWLDKKRKQLQNIETLSYLAIILGLSCWMYQILPNEAKWMALMAFLTLGTGGDILSKLSFLPSKKSEEHIRERTKDFYGDFAENNTDWEKHGLDFMYWWDRKSIEIEIKAKGKTRV